MFPCVSRHADALPYQSGLGDKDPAGAAVQCRPFPEALQGNDGRPRENIPSRGYPGTIQGTSTDFKLTPSPLFSKCTSSDLVRGVLKVKVNMQPECKLWSCIISRDHSVFVHRYSIIKMCSGF